MAINYYSSLIECHRGKFKDERDNNNNNDKISSVILNSTNKKQSWNFFHFTPTWRSVSGIYIESVSSVLHWNAECGKQIRMGKCVCVCVFVYHNEAFVVATVVVIQRDLMCFYYIFSEEIQFQIVQMSKERLAVYKYS